jgi:NAD dependent epimerase/dehydratase family enzyme
MRTLLTGATRLIGKALVPRLEDTVVSSRDPEHARHVLAGVEAHAWSFVAGPPAAALRGIDVVFNLAGEPLAATHSPWVCRREFRRSAA